jgi:hypothetical protein
MKALYLIIILFPLLLEVTSCSSTYTVTDFSSKEDFYNYVNKNISNREVNVTLNNDSTFTTNDIGAQVNQNFLTLKLYSYKDTTVPLSEIQNMNYESNLGKPPTYIKLKNGNTINAENIRRSANSLEFDVRVSYPYNIPINKINKVSYKSTSVGIINGIFIGIGSGLLLTVSKVIPASIREGNPPYPDDYDYYGVGLLA